ncbi:hypothetical protein, partial [Burkholderia sp. MSMB175]|uniref:hypothetical protein n=1 Tax=Burkholderia sp. MSMB175 TaxID=1086510 RepID=UPI001CA57486
MTNSEITCLFAKYHIAAFAYSRGATLAERCVEWLRHSLFGRMHLVRSLAVSVRGEARLNCLPALMSLTEWGFVGGADFRMPSARHLPFSVASTLMDLLLLRR